MNTRLSSPDLNTDKLPAPFAPFRLFFAIISMVLIMQAFVLIQGYFIRLADLNRLQITVMIRPVYIYALPALYAFSKWLGYTLPQQVVFLATMLALSSVLLTSYMNYLCYKLPFAHSITDIYILITYLALSILGGLQGKKKALNSHN